MTTVSLNGISIPIVSSKLEENNTVDLRGTTSVRAVRHVDLVAEKGIGSERARTDGLVMNISAIPYAMRPIGPANDVSNNTVTLGGAATVEAGMNYKTQFQILPIFVNGERKLSADRLGQALTDAEKSALGLDASQQYEYAPLGGAD